MSDGQLKKNMKGLLGNFVRGAIAGAVALTIDHNIKNQRTAAHLLRDMHDYKRLQYIATDNNPGKAVDIDWETIRIHADMTAKRNDLLFDQWYAIPWYKRIFATLSDEDTREDHLLKYVRDGTKF